MARFGFCSGFYTLKTANADCQAAINWMPERDESGMGVSDAILLPTPGLRTAYALPTTPVRALYLAPSTGRCFAVAGASLYELLADGTHKEWAILNSNVSTGTPVTMVDNSAKQLMICSQGVLTLFDMNTNTWTGGYGTLGPYGKVEFIDGYFMATTSTPQTAQFSALEDGTSWDPADTVRVSVFSDPIVGMLEDHREVWFWGSTRSIAYVNTGDPDTPFQPTPSSIIEHGMAAAASPIRLDNTVFWVGRSEQGIAIAIRLAGYLPTRISTHAIEDEWQSYSTVADAISYAYQENGHSFWVIYFPTANKTWVYDVSTQQWHQRAFWDNGQYVAHRSRCHAFFNNQHLVGDWKSGNVYQMSSAFNTDFGSGIRRLRRAPHVTNEQTFVKHRQLQVYMESGIQPDPAITETEQPDGISTLVLQASDGSNWALSIDDSGLFQTSSLDQFQVPQVVLLKAGSLFWQLGVNPDGTLKTTLVTNYGQPQYAQLTFLTPGRTMWQLQVNTDGTLKTFGPIAPLTREPKVSLRWSDDGGHSWSNEHFAGTGHVGEYRKRVIWRALGRSRDRVYELTASDPIPYRVVDAYLIAEPGYTPTPRISENVRKSV